MVQFSGIITPQSIVFTAPDGKPFNVTSAHRHFDAMREVFKKLQAALKAGDPEAETLHRHLVALADIPQTIVRASKGRVEVKDGVVHYLGEAVHNAVTERILWGLSEGYDMDPYIRFLDNLMDNPSKRAVDELYGFIEKHKMGITEDGFIIAYKKIRGDYTDIHSGKFDNSPGQVLEMPRNRVDDDKTRTCSDGFHFCAFAYLPEFGTGPGNRVVIVKVNPADVVSIPADYNDAKARCCRYEVIGEYTGADLQDVLGKKPVFSGNDWSTSDDDGDDRDEDEGVYDWDEDGDDWIEDGDGWDEDVDEDDGASGDRDAPEAEPEGETAGLTAEPAPEEPAPAPIPVQDVRLGFDPATGGLVVKKL